MTSSLSGLDLLRERRIELGLPADPPRPAHPRRLLLIGGAVGGGLVAAAVGLSLLLRWQQQMLSNELQRLAPVQSQVDGLEAQLKGEQATTEAIRKGNLQLAEGLVAVRSGTALMTDLSQRTSTGLQLTALKVNRDDLELKGRSTDPGAFERINALVLRLKASSLLDPAAVKLGRAKRAASETGPKAGPSPLVTFELTAGFREPLTGSAQLRLLQGLGADGMARRLELLQRQGLLP
jgi:type IV pilus assembly protein PilN